MKKTEAQKKIEEIELEMVVGSRLTDLNRSRSISVGTSFGGTTELSMRGDGGKYLWCNMQPVEVTELIHQLSANIGCHVALKPRDDFGSWREWRIPEAEKKHLNGHAPFVNDMAPFQNLGTLGYNQQQVEQLMADWLKIKEYEPAPKNVLPGGPGGEGGFCLKQEENSNNQQSKVPLKKRNKVQQKEKS